MTRFICVDDASTDGTFEYLLEQDDVDVWHSPVRYENARRGRSWREKLFEIYGKDRWYLNVDCDEFLVYEDCEIRNIWSIIHSLESCGYARLAAPMLDLYPSDLAGARPEKLAHFAPWEIADHFDTSGYKLSIGTRALSLKGGRRQQNFGSDFELMKYPLIFWDDHCRLGVSIHQPLPFERNFIPILGALLHFKIFSDASNKAVVEKADWAGDLHIAGSGALRYSGVNQLLELGFFGCIPRAKP